VARNGADVSTTLYRAYDERGVLLYVGIANTPLLRVEQHSSTARWACYAAKITFERHPSRPEAAEAEVTAIKVEKPAFNIAHSGGGGELELAYLEDPGRCLPGVEDAAEAVGHESKGAIRP
jgi:hypothetical protein